MANLKISQLTDENAVSSADRALILNADGTGPKWNAVSAEKFTEKGLADLGIVPQKRIETTVDPTVNDDSASGYAVNDLWTNTTDDTSWICVDATATAAVWKPIALTKTGTAAPAVAPDFVGQVFLDTTNENIYIGIDTVNAADFLQVNGGGGGGAPYSDLEVTEAADHTTTPAAGKGIYWVRNDTPNKPIFTDDDGVDHDLTLGEWHTVIGDLPSGTSFPSGTDRNLYFIVPYDCTLKEIRWWADKAVGADASNYWTLMPQRIASGSNVDLLDAAWDNSGGLVEHLSYDLGTITTNGTDAQLSKGDVLHCVYTTVGTPTTNFFGGRCSYLLYLEPR